MAKQFYFKKLLFLLLITQIAYAQNAKIKWTDVQKINYKEEGTGGVFLGDSDNHLFLISGKRTMLYQYKEAYLQVMDRKTLALKKNIPIYNKKEEKSSFISDFNLGDIVGILKSKEESGKVRVLLDLLDVNQASKKGKKPLTVFEINKEKSHFDLFVRRNKTTNNFMVAYIENKKGSKDLQLNYKIYNAITQEIINSGKAQLPIQLIKDWSYSLVSNIREEMYLGDDNNIHLMSRLVEDPKAKIKQYFNQYSIISSETGELKVFNLNTKEKNLYEPIIITEKSKTKIFGFYQDKPETQKKSLNDIDGYYFVVFDLKKMDFEEIKFHKFSAAELAKLAKAEGQAAAVKSETKEGASKQWKIEKIINYNNETYLVGSKVNNYTYTVQTKNGSYTRDVCEKTNILILRLDPKGEILSFYNHYRYNQYDSHNYRDLNFLVNNNKLQIIYPDATSSNFKTFIIMDSANDEVYKDGIKYDYENKSINYNKIRGSMVTDDLKDMYFIYNKAKLKPGNWVPTILLAPTLYVPWYIVKSERTYNYYQAIGKVELNDSKSKKKK